MSGNGFCFIKSIQTSLFQDHNIYIGVPSLIEAIRAHIKDNIDNYKDYYTGSSQQMLSNVELFFRTGEYNLDIVDIIISASAKALNINIFIYQNDHGQIKVLKQNSGCSTVKDVYVKYSSDHYDSIVFLSREGDQTNYLVLSNTSADSAADTADDDSPVYKSNN